MKSTFKILVGLGCICSTISCGTLPVEAYVAVNCPRTENKTSYNNQDVTPEPDSRASKIVNTSKESVTTASQNNGPESELMLSYRMGVGTSVPINHKLTFMPRIVLSGKGNKTEEAGFENRLNSTYIDVPLLVSYTIRASKFNVNAGLQPSILVSAKQTITGNGSEESQDVKDRFNTFDLALTAGLGYQFDNGIGINLGYDHGLSNINNSDAGFGSVFKAYNRAMHLGVTYTFKAK